MVGGLSYVGERLRPRRIDLPDQVVDLLDQGAATDVAAQGDLVDAPAEAAQHPGVGAYPCWAHQTSTPATATVVAEAASQRNG